MKVGIHANMCDTETQKISFALHEPFRALGRALEGEYGGTMEHLWIDLELIEDYCKQGSTERFPFRFQKRVSGRSHFGLPPSDDKFNVVHYSVRPDFHLLKSLATAQAVPYVLSLIFKSTGKLAEKKKRIGEFDLALFQRKYRDACMDLGFDLAIEAGQEEVVPAAKDGTAERPIPSAWRPTLRKIVAAFAKGDFLLGEGIADVAAVSPETAEHIQSSLRDYGATLKPLPDETWNSSVCIWIANHWDFMVDLYTSEEGASDLVLSGRVTETSSGFKFASQIVYVP